MCTIGYVAKKRHEIALVFGCPAISLKICQLMQFIEISPKFLMKKKTDLRCAAVKKNSQYIISLGGFEPPKLFL